MSGQASITGERIKSTEFLTLESAVEAAARRWEGTPYAAGGRAVGGGVDCVRFVCGVWDALLGVAEPTAVPASTFDGGAYKGVIAGLGAVYGFELVRPRKLVGAGGGDAGWDFRGVAEPGDAVLCSSWGWAGGQVGAGGGGVSLRGSERYHVLLVGGGGASGGGGLWHANEPMGVERVGWQVVGPLARLVLRPGAVRSAVLARLVLEDAPW